MLKNQASIFTLPRKINLKPFVYLILGGVAPLMITAKPAAALTTDFQDEYAPANWTFTNANANGAVNTAAAPTSIGLTGGDNGSSSIGRTSYTITASSSGTVSFIWVWSTKDLVTETGCVAFSGNLCDPLIRVLNGTETILIRASGASLQGGLESFSVIRGDVFGFRIGTNDNLAGSASATFSSFSAPSATPVPFEFSPVVGVTMLGVGYRVKRLWHKNKATKL
jgi:hypothetical protein